MRFLLTLLLVFSLSSPVHAQAPSEAEPNVEDLLISANSKKALAAREIAQSPNRVAGELARVMARMDRLFQEQVQERFDAHYKKVEQSLQTVSLPEDVGSLEVAWQQAKAGVYDSSDLDALLEGFIRRAQTTVEPQQEELAGHIDSQFKETLTAELKQAQDTIRAPFQEILAHYFPTQDVPQLSALPIPRLLGSQEGEDGKLLPGPVIALPSGLGWHLGKILAKVTGKKHIHPIVLSLWGAYEVWKLGQAKTDLEHELRTKLLSVYKENFSPAIIWSQPVRQQLEQEIRTSLLTWSDHYRMEAERLLTAKERDHKRVIGGAILLALLIVAGSAVWLLRKLLAGDRWAFPPDKPETN